MNDPYRIQTSCDASITIEATTDGYILKSWYLDQFLLSQHYDSLRKAIVSIQERVEMQYGVRCADCGKRFSMANHYDCIPF